MNGRGGGGARTPSNKRACGGGHARRNYRTQAAAIGTTDFGTRVREQRRQTRVQASGRTSGSQGYSDASSPNSIVRPSFHPLPLRTGVRLFDNTPTKVESAAAAAAWHEPKFPEKRKSLKRAG